MKKSGLLFSVLLVFAFPLIVQAQDTKENAEFKLAVGLYNDGYYPQAEDQFKVFVDKFPNTALGIEARFYLGLIQLRTKKYSEAQSTFQDFALRYPENVKAPDAWWNLGEAYAAERNHAEAASAFARLKTFHPKSKRAPEALIQASRFFLKAGDFDNAKLSLNSILIEYPQSDVVMDANYSMGRMLISSGDYELALRELRRVQNSGAASPSLKGRATVAIGEVNALLGNRDEAEAKFREAISLYGKTDAVYEAHVRLGDLQRQYRKFSEALASYDAVAKNPAAPMEMRQEAYIGAAESAVAAEQYADAIKAYDAFFTAFKDQTNEPSVYRRAAAAAKKGGDFAKALRYLEQLYNDPSPDIDKREVLVEMAGNASEGKKFNIAIQYYQQYLKQYPTDDGAPYALYEIAEIHEKEFRNYARGLELYSGIIDRFSGSPVADRAQMGKARTLASLGRFDDAAEAYRQVTVQFPASAMYDAAWKEYIRILRFQGGSASDAIRNIAAVLSAMTEKPNSASVDVLIGKIYLDDLKDFSLASKYFSSALNKGITGEEAERAAYGKALAAVRLTQKGESGALEAEQLLSNFIQQYPIGKNRDDAGYELFLIQSEGKSPSDVLDAALKFLALNPTAHLEEVRLEYADALRILGKNTEAEQEYARLLTGKKESEISGEAYYGRGLVRIAQMNFSGAADDFRSYDRALPNGKNAANALMSLGAVLARTGLYEDAARSYESLAERFPYSNLCDSAQIAMLNTLAEGGMLDRAAARVGTFLQRARNNPFLSDDVISEYLYIQALLLAKSRDATGAKRALQQYATEFPRGKRIGEAYYALGQIFKAEGKISLATSYLQQAGSINPGGQARQDAADLFMEDGRYADAIREYEKLAESVTSKLEKSYAQSRIVVALYRSDKIQEAQKRADDFKSQYPDAKPVFDEFELERGKYLFRQKQYKQALDIFENVEDSKTQTLAAFGKFWIAKTFEAQSQNQKAEEGFLDVIKKHSGTEAALEATFALARMALRAEKYDIAAQQFKSVADAQKVPQAMLKEALSGLINCYDELKLYDAAVEMTKRFLTLFPGDPTAFRKRVNLGVFYYQLRYFDQAITHLESLLSQATPDDQAEIRYYIGESYFYKGDFTQAALEFLKVTYLVVQKTEIDWKASALYMAGQSYEKQNKYQLALDMYQRIISTPGIDARFKAQAEKEVARVKALIK